MIAVGQLSRIERARSRATVLMCMSVEQGHKLMCMSYGHAHEDKYLCQRPGKRLYVLWQ